jgi:hypothetical protein
MSELAHLKLALLATLDQFGERAVWDENVFRAARLKIAPQRLPRADFVRAMQALQIEGAIAAAPGPLGQTAWKITATGRAILAELLP